MKSLETESIDELILREKRSVARDLINEAWEDGIEAGIETDILAREMMYALINGISESIGPQGAIELTKQMSKKAQEGCFLPPQQLQ